MNVLTPALAPNSTIRPDLDRVDGISTSDAISAGDAFFAMVEVATLTLPDAALALPKVAPIVADPLVEQSVEALLKADRVVPGIDPALFFSGDGRLSGVDDLAADPPHSATVPLPSAKKVAHLTGNAPPAPSPPDVTAKAASPTFLARPEEPAPSMDAVPSDRASVDHMGTAARDPAFIAAMPLLAIAIPQSAGLAPESEPTHPPLDLEPDAPNQPGTILPPSADLGIKPATSPMPPDLRAPPPAAKITGSYLSRDIIPINPQVMPLVALSAIDDPQPSHAQSGQTVAEASLAQTAALAMPLRQESCEPPPITVDPRRPQTKAGYLQTSSLSPAPLPDLWQRPALPTVAAASVRLTDPPPADGHGPFAAPTASGPALHNPAASPDDAQQQPSDPQPRRETSNLPPSGEPPPPPHQAAPGILIRLDAAGETVPDAREHQAISTRWPSPQPVSHGSLPRPNMIQSDLPLAAPTREPALDAPRSTDVPTLSSSPDPSGLEEAFIFPRQTPQAGLVKPESAASAMLPTVQVPGLPRERDGFSRNQHLSDNAFLWMREAAFSDSAQTDPALAHQRATLSQPNKHDGAPQQRFLVPDLPIDPSHAAPGKEGNSNGPLLPTAPVAGFHFEPTATIPLAPATASVAAGPQTERRPNPPPFVTMRGQVRLEPVAADRTPLSDLTPRALTPPIAVPKPAPDAGPQAEASPFVIAHPEALAKTPQFPAPATQTLTTALVAKDRSRPFRATDHLQADVPKAAQADPIVAKPRRATAIESKHRIDPMPPVRADDAPPIQIPRPDSTALPPPHQPSHGPSVQSSAADRPPPLPANPESRTLPHALPSALAKAASHARTDDRVEMTLDPVELGKVRFEFSTISDRMQVNLVVERSETLDLLRRNADALRAEFLDAGFDGASLTFSHWGQGRRDDQPAPVARFDSFSADTAPTTPLPARTRTATGQGLDLRL